MSQTAIGRKQTRVRVAFPVFRLPLLIFTGMMIRPASALARFFSLKNNSIRRSGGWAQRSFSKVSLNSLEHGVSRGKLFETTCAQVRYQSVKSFRLWARASFARLCAGLLQTDERQTAEDVFSLRAISGRRRTVCRGEHSRLVSGVLLAVINIFSAEPRALPFLRPFLF